MTARALDVKLSIGPLQYFWEREQVFAFYDVIATAPVDVVYLGEVVCSKRRALRFDDWVQIAWRLAAAGKEVVLSTLALIEAESEIAYLRRVVANGEFLVEANDMAAVDALRGEPFVAGPHLNVYNERTLDLLMQWGASRWVAPLELSLDTIAKIRDGAGQSFTVESFAFGRLPLAFSARCFTARAHNIAKDECQFVCRQYPDGLTLHSREPAPFLAFNGIQTQSAATQNAIRSLAELRQSGVDVLRLSPQSQQFLAVIDAFRKAVDEPDADAAALMPDAFLPGGYCDGYLHGLPGMSVTQS